MEKIEFYIPKGETIPTGLSLKVGDVQVCYRKDPMEFAYLFHVFGAQNKDIEKEIIEHLAHVMCHQSYDHGAEWRVTGIGYIPETKYTPGEWKVSFRIKDMY